MFIDPVLPFLSALLVIYTNLPFSFRSLIGVVAVLSVVIIILKVVRSL